MDVEIESTARQRKQSRSAEGRSLRLTPRDRSWLRFGGRQRVFEAAQLAAIASAGSFGSGSTASVVDRRPSLARVTRRLAELRAAGHVEPVRIFAGPWGWRATGMGLRAAGLDLEPSRVDYRQYAHDIDCGWLSIELEAEFGERVWTEREIWTHDRGETAPAFCPAEVRAGRSRLLRIPDLAIAGFGADGEALAIELERSQKSRTRLAAIVDLYAASPQLAGVRFYCTEEAVRGVERAIANLAYGGERFEVLAWEPRKEIAR